jgi:hypothetical protein
MMLKPQQKPSKDDRVSYLGKALAIGAMNTLEVCKNFILAALPKLHKGFEYQLYQRVAIGNTSDNYRFLEILALFTALHLQAEADKQTLSQKYKYQDMKAQRTGCNPYLDFLEQPDIKFWTKSQQRHYLLALSKATCDPQVLSSFHQKGSRHIELPEEKKSSKPSSQVPSQIGH